MDDDADAADRRQIFLPIFLANEIYTMPQFLERRYGPGIRTPGITVIFLLGLFWKRQ